MHGHPAWTKIPVEARKAGQDQAVFSLLSLPEAVPPQTDFKIVAGVYGEKTALDVVSNGRVVGQQAYIGAIKRWFPDRLTRLSNRRRSRR